MGIAKPKPSRVTRMVARRLVSRVTIVAGALVVVDDEPTILVITSFSLLFEVIQLLTLSWSHVVGNSNALITE